MFKVLARHLTTVIEKLHMLIFKPTYSEITWGKYMGNWHEPDQIPEGNDLTLHKIAKCNIPPHDYKDVFTISKSKLEHGNPNLNELFSLLRFHCSEIESLRNKPNIGYYADSGSGLCINGYRDIHKEGVKHLDGLVSREMESTMREVDFILSSLGGWIEPTIKISNILRKRFSQISFLLPGSAYSGASFIALCGDEIIMQSFGCHMAPINPRVNGFDTYIGKQVYRTHLLQKIFVPWAAKNLPDAKIAENNVTMKTMRGLEKLVRKTTKFNLKQYVFKLYKLPLLDRIKMAYKIRKIVNFMTDFRKHLTHQNVLLSPQLQEIGLPVRDAEEKLDIALKTIRNICEEITLNCWGNETNDFFVRKLYFTSKDCYALYYVPPETNQK